MVAKEQTREKGQDCQLSTRLVKINLSLLKHRDLDTLEGIFQLWSQAATVEDHCVQEAFEQRVLHLLQSRIANKVRRDARPTTI